MPSRDKLVEFTAWCAQHVTGDEQGDAQLFLDRLAAKAARLKNEADFNYSSKSVFDTFPWPQFPESSSRRKEALTSSEVGGKNDRSLVTSSATVTKIDAVAEAARELRRVRAEALPKMKGGLRALYRTLELPGANPLKDAHAALDTAVLTAYGFNAKKDLLAQLLALNQQVAAKIEKGEPVAVPGVPKNYPDAKKLVTDDCIRPQVLV